MTTHRGETWRRAMGDFAELSGPAAGAGGRPTPASYAIDKTRLPVHLREAVVVLASDDAYAAQSSNPRLADPRQACCSRV